ncbi:MAG: hypothetical protein V2A58_01665 [Planctomycetota bacterium]
MHRACPVAVLLIVLIHLGGSSVTAETPAASPDPSWRPAPPAHAEDLVERFYVDDKTPPSPTPEEKARGFILYRRPCTDLVFPNSTPAARERVDVLSTFAALDEYEAITFALYALKDLSGVTLELSDLRLAEGSFVLPSADADLRVARGLFKRITHYSGPGEFMYMPTWLARFDSLEVPGGQSTWLWLTLHVPADAFPGTYRGTLRVSAAETVEIPVEIEVLSITLPGEPDVNFGFYDAPTLEKLAQQRAHGMTSVGWYGEAGLAPSVSNDSLSVDFAGTNLERVLEAYRRAGFRRPILWLMPGDVYKWCAKEAEPGSERFAKLYGDIMRLIREEANRRGWAEIITQPDDECPSHADRMGRSRIALPLLKAAGFRTEMDHYLAYSDNGGDNDKWVAETLPHVDVITLRYWFEKRLGQEPWDVVAERVAKLGKELWTYNITAAHMFPQPASMRFNGGWFFRTHGKTCKGMYFWAYWTGPGDPYNDLDGANSDFRYYYPADPARGLSGGASIDLACMREGLDDLRYVEALERLIEASPQSSSAVRARATLDELLRSFNFSEARRRAVEGTKSVWETLEEHDGRRTARGWYLYPNGWKHKSYDEARRTLASAILSLEGAP